jgi:hypothetical protein
MLDYYIRSFESNKMVFKELFGGVSDSVYNWREADDKWNLLEVLCHLHDEEREDFRARLESVLKDPAHAFHSIDPAEWVKERKYAQQNYNEVLEKFLNERQYSINWLKSLNKPSWNNTYQHPQFGPMSASFIIANWLAHDYLHIRQVTRIKYNYLKSFSGEKMDYAGEW